jgi:hypothetical protein
MNKTAKNLSKLTILQRKSKVMDISIPVPSPILAWQETRFFLNVGPRFEVVCMCVFVCPFVCPKFLESI